MIVRFIECTDAKILHAAGPGLPVPRYGDQVWLKCVKTGEVRQFRVFAVSWDLTDETVDVLLRGGSWGYE